MDTVIQSRQILRYIFENCDRKSNANNATVCKFWSEVCLDVIWYEVTSWRRLFGLLGTCVRQSTIEGADYSFQSSNPSYEQWRRFRSVYAPRIRRIVLYTPEKPLVGLTSMIDAVARFRTAVPFLPRLKSIDWRGLSLKAPTSAVWMFMHSTVTDFRLRASSIQDDSKLLQEDFSRFLEIVEERMPRLTTLEVRVGARQELEEPLATLLSSLATLETAVLPLFPDSSKLLKVASTLPRLKKLSIGHRDHWQLCEVESITRDIAWGSFPELGSFTTICRCSALVNLFSNSPLPLFHLTRIDLRSITQINSPLDVRNLFTALAESCGELTVFALILTTEGDYWKRERDSPSPDFYADEIIRFEHFSPILKCSRMASFELLHKYPCSFGTQNAETIAISWPHLVRLSLSQMPAVPRINLNEIECLTLRSLVPFTVFCPLLTHLGLPIAVPTHASIPRSLEYANYKPFTNLRTLTVDDNGFYGGEEDVAMFLLHILPVGCVVKYDGDSDFEEGSAGAKWTEIATALSLMRRIRY